MIQTVVLLLFSAQHVLVLYSSITAVFGTYVLVLHSASAVLGTHMLQVHSNTILLLCLAHIAGGASNRDHGEMR